jgi:NAD(P)H-hydrate epimerase
MAEAGHRRDTAALVLDRAGVRAVDRAAVEEYGIPGLVLMENAAIGLREAALDLIGRAPGPRIVIVCGGGNNGGDGYALARHLHNEGMVTTLVPLAPPRPRSDAAVNRAIDRCMRLPERPPADLPGVLAGADLIVDAIFGTGLDRPPGGAEAQAIGHMNDAAAGGTPILAADVPSGLDCETGEALGLAVRATMTVTFVALKPGLTSPRGRALAGEIRVASIGAPIELIRRFALPPAP